MNVHVLNALSYTGEVLLRALRFSAEEALRDWAKDNFVRGLRKLDEALRRSSALGAAAPHNGPLEDGFRFNLAKNKAVQLWVVALVAEHDRVTELAPAIAEAVRTIYEATKGSDQIERLKRYNPFLTELIRVISFTAKETNHERALTLCQHIFVDLLNQVSRILPADAEKRSKSSIRKDANKIVQFLIGAGVTVPPRLLNAIGGGISTPS